MLEENGVWLRSYGAICQGGFAACSEAWNFVMHAASSL